MGGMFRQKYFYYLQAAGWALAAILFFFYLRERLFYHGTAYVAGITIVSFLSFMLVIYGYVYQERLKLFKNAGWPKLILLNILFFALVVLLRIILEIAFVAPLTNRNTIFNFSRQQIAYDIVSVFIAFIVGILLKSAIDYLRIYKEQEALKLKQAETEMRLLKAQVQPHFLFNSLNNIYYVAYKDSPKTAELLEKLSLIMRYFLNETVKEKVSLREELNFVFNYIDMENLRLHNKAAVQFEKNADDSIMIPPMLLIPLIENVFKHGVDRMGPDNSVEIKICSDGAWLEFHVRNKKIKNGHTTTGGFGLNNLRERLNLLYKNNFTLHTQDEGNTFSATLKIPIA
jgi:LytS/YehU family sensor histidine kinase